MNQGDKSGKPYILDAEADESHDSVVYNLKAAIFAQQRGEHSRQTNVLEI